MSCDSTVAAGTPSRISTLTTASALCSIRRQVHDVLEDECRTRFRLARRSRHPPDVTRVLVLLRNLSERHELVGRIRTQLESASSICAPPLLAMSSWPTRHLAGELLSRLNARTRRISCWRTRRTEIRPRRMVWPVRAGRGGSQPAGRCTARDAKPWLEQAGRGRAHQSHPAWLQGHTELAVLRRPTGVGGT